MLITSNKLRSSLGSKSQPGPPKNVERPSKLSGADAPTFTAEQLVDFLASYENRRRQTKYARKLHQVSSDVRHPLFENMWDDVRPGPDVCYDDVYDSLIGKFVPQSGNVEARMYPGGYYFKDGKLDETKSKRYETLNELCQMYLYYQDPRIGPFPPSDLFQFALDNPAPTTYVDKYDFSMHSVMMADYFIPSIDLTNSTPVPIVSRPTLSPTLPPTYLLATQIPTTVQPTTAPTFLRGIIPQSGLEESQAGATSSSAITQFVDENPDWEVGITHSKDDSYYAADTGDVGLAEFFARPIVLGSVAWTSNSTAVLALDLDPWDIFFKNPRVVNRICNYRNLRCNLKIKVMINGSQFHFGRAIVAHSPLGVGDELLNKLSNTALTSLPHILLDPSTSQGGVIEIPYLHHYNSYDIPKSDWMGRSQIIVRALTPLGHLAGNIENVTITVMAWAEDVLLSCPTSAEPFVLSPQAGDEYGKGIVSRPAYAVAHHAGLLKHIPFLKPYATATQIGAGAVGDIARMFGFSRPNNVSEAVYAKPSLTTSFANVDSSDTINKLTFDAKQETTVDPRTVGLGANDAMAFTNIVTREAYLTQFDWKQTTGLPGTLLFNVGVNPWSWSEQLLPGPTGGQPFALPPASFITLPFKYWRGTIRYRFQFCNSIMHRGRVRISYDPYFALGGNTEYNTAMNEIVDIGANNDFTIEVGWHSPRSYLPVGKPGVIPVASLYGPAALTAAAADLHNGVLYVHVVNELTTPATSPGVTNDIKVNVFVSASEDFEVFDPDPAFMESYLYLPQSGAEEVISDSSAPLGAPLLRKFGNGCMTNHAIIYHGDPIVSIRTAIKRYTLYRRTASPTLNFTIPFVWIWNQSAIPWLKGKGPGGNINGVSYVHNTPMTYFGPAFLGSRGGVRHKMMILADQPNANILLQISRSSWQAPESNVAVPLATSPSFLTSRSAIWAGGAIAHHDISPLVEAEVPYSSDRRYRSNRLKNPAQIGTESFMRMEAVVNRYPVGGLILADDYIAAADDYSMFYFIGAPILYRGVLV